MPSLLEIQWGIVGFFVLIHFIFGFLRGSSKSTYFSIVSIVTTFISLWLISLLSFNLLISENFTLSSGIDLITGMIGFPIPSEFMVYIEDPQIVAIVFAFADLVLRITAFISFYPVIKFFITLIVFRPIWKHGIQKNLLKKQNDKALAQFEESPRGKKKFVPSKKLNKNFIGRFWGGFMGGVRGFVMAFVFLLPILVLAGFLADVPDVITLRAFKAEEQLSAGNDTDLITLPPVVQDYLAQIDEMNTNGLGAITRQIVISGKPVDRYLFDMIFTTQVLIEDEEPIDINFVQEVGNIVGIAQILVEGGYLDNYDFTTISTENLEDIQAIMGYLGQSDMVGVLVPLGTRYAVNNLLPDMINGINLYDREYSAAALNQFTSTDWEAEFGNLYGIIEAILEFGSVSELMTYASNPGLLAELTPEQGVKLANVIRAIGELQFYALISAGADLATVLPQVQSMITWMDPSEVEGYLQERLAFIIQNPNFFKGEEGEIARLASLVEFLFEDEGTLTAIYAATQDGASPDQIAEALDGEWVGSLLQRVVDLELLMNLIPFGVDYGLYSVSGNLIEAEIADQIAERLEDVSWEEEILNIGDIYAEVFKMGVAALLGTDPNYVAFADDVFVNHMTEIRTIVSKIFDDSEVVNAAIEIVSPYAIDRFVTNDELKSLLNDALISDPLTGVVDFSFGQEINTILSMIESIYGFTTIGELSTISVLTAEQQLDLMSRFGSLTQAEYDDLTDAIESLQLLQRVGEAGLEYLRNSQGIQQLYVPAGVQVGEELTTIIGIAYYAAQYVYDNRFIYDNYEEIDFAPLFADEVFRSHLLNTELDNHSDLLLTNIAHNIKLYSTDPSAGNYIAVPQVLLDANNENALWMTEINYLLGAVLDLLASFEDSDVLTLSARDVLTIANDPLSASVTLFTQFADFAQTELAFGSLDQSTIFRTSIVKAIGTYGSVTVDALNGYSIGVPEAVKDGDMLEAGTFVELIHGFATIAEDFSGTLGFVTMGDLVGGLSTDNLLAGFNQISDETLDTFTSITLIRGLFTELVVSDEIQGYLKSIVDGTGVITVPDDFFSIDPILMDGDLFKQEELKNIFIAIKALGFTDGASLSSAGPATLAELQGRNVDLITGKDDFDRVFDANFLYIFIDRVLQLDSLGDFVGTTLGTALGATIDTIDLTPPAAMLGTIADSAVEVGRIPKAEFRRVFNSFGLLGDTSAIGLGTFLNLIDPTIDPLTEDDDFETFIASDFIYVILGRLLNVTAFGDYVGDLLSGAFGDDPITLDMTPPSDAKGQVVGDIEEGLMTRFELRQLMLSFKMLGLENGTDISVSTILGMIGANEDLSGDDDFDRFLASLYIQDKISILLLADPIIEILAAGRFLPEEFILPAGATVNVDGRDRMTKQEIYNLFNGLVVLGLSDLEGANLGLDTITALDDAQINEVLSASYLYVIIDLMLKSETQLILPPDAFESGGIYDGMVKKTEILNVLNAFEILGSSNPGDIDPNNITLDTIEDLLDLNSPIIDQLMSDAIVEALTGNPLNAVGSDTQLSQGSSSELAVIAAIPTNALNGAGTRLLRTEMYALIEALRAMNILDLNATIDVDAITLSQLEAVHYIGLGTDPLGDTFESYLLHRLLSESIMGAITVPAAAKMGTDDINPDEISALIAALEVMNLTSLADPIDVNEITLAQLASIHHLGLGTDPLGDVYESYIIHRLISEAVIGAVDVPVNALMVGSTEDLVADEISALIAALEVMNLTTLADPIDVDTITLSQLESIHHLGLGTDPLGDDYDSYIIHRLISTSVISAVTVPADALMGAEDVEPDEISALIAALEVMNLTTLADPIDVDTITLTQLSNIHYLGLGINPLGDDYDSYIIHRLISTSVISAVTVPDDAKMGADDVEPNEISALIAALDVMNLTTLADPIDVDSITLTQLGNIHYLGLGINPLGDDYESLIIHRLISTSVISAVEVPDDAYVLNSTEDVKPEEISALIASLAVMNLTTLSDTIDVNAITLTQLQNIHYLGLGTDPVDEKYESLIIHRLISEAVITAVEVPSGAMLGTDDVQPDEISALILSLGVMNLTTLGDTIDVNAITLTQLEDIHHLGLGIDPLGDDYESLIIHRLISDAVIAAVEVPDDAKMNADDVEPLEISALIQSLSVMNLTTLGDSIDVNAITLTQLQNIHYLGLGIDPVDDKYESLIIHRLISDAVIAAVEVPDDAKMNPLDVEPLEISALIAALDEMDLNTLGDPIDVDTITLTQLQNIHYLGLGTDPVDDDYESLIIHRLISDAVIAAVDVPSGAMLGTDDVQPDEISALILSLDEMGLNTLGDPINVNIITLTQLQNIHYLGLGIDPLGDDYESLIIHRLISDAVIAAVEVPDDAKMNPLDVEPLEISALILSLDEMGLNTLGDPIDVDTITLTQLQNIHYLGLGTDPVEDDYESLIIHRLISDSVIAAVDVPSGAMLGTDDVQPDEISALILALDEMGLNSLGDPINVNIITLAQLRAVHYLGLGTDPVLDTYESLILHRLISDAVIGVVDVPDDAYITGSTEDVEANEVSALIDALQVMGLSSLGDPINVAGIQISELQDIHYLGLGIDPVDNTYDSLIIHRLISDAITTTLETPSGAYIVGSLVDLLELEVQGVIDALLLLAGGDDTETMSGLTPVANTVLTPTLIEDLLDLDALIIYRLIASGIITATLATDESLAEVGDDNYDASDIGADVKISEMYALVEAMNIMGIANLSVSIDATTVTISDLQDLHYVGLGIDPVTDTYQSRIVHRILSDAITSALDDPSTAYMMGSSEDLLAAEIQGVIDAMLELGAPTSTLDSLTPINNNALTATVLQNLININTRIVDRLIADGIIAAGIATTPSYAVSGDINYDPTAINEDIKRTEMQHVVDSMVILGVTSVLTIATDITIVKLQTLTPAQIEDLVEAGTDGPNTIIYYIISETVDSTNTLYDTLVILDPITYPGPADNYYVLDGFSNRLRLKRTSIEGAI